MSVYYITLMIFVCTTIPSIQNLGNSILMAYNKMKRKNDYCDIRFIIELRRHIPLCEILGCRGCSFPIFLCIVITYGPILNKMYARVIGINVRQFWIEILKMSLVPSLFVVAGLLILPYTDFSDWGKLGLGIIAFSVFYLPVSYRLSLNNYERNYFNSFMRKDKICAMKILILGGTGAIGTPLIAILRQNQDIQICVTSRSEHSSEENVQYLKADVLNQSELENILMRNHWDAVIDFMIYSESVFRQRIGLLLKSTDQYFFLSSATEYSDLDEIITEKTPRLLDVTTDKELFGSKAISDKQGVM